MREPSQGPRQRAAFEAESEAALKDQFDALMLQIYRGGIDYEEALREFRKVFITVALRENKGSISRAALRLGLHRNTLSRIIGELELDVAQLRAPRRPPGSVSTISEKKALR